MTRTAQLTASIIDHACFAAMSDHIVWSTGLVYYADRPEMLAQQIADRVAKLGLSSCPAYWELLQDGSAGEYELDQLIEHLTIGETHFFRHRELFDAIRDVALPDILERNCTTRSLRVWSAGCSTGPEAYSVSIVLRRDLQTSVEGWNVCILGTDINRPSLSQATDGRYEEWAFRGTSQHFRSECFKESDKVWQIAPQYQNGVSFQYHNLALHPFPSLVHNLVAFDLILCRNVLIYFAPEVAQRIISQLANCLAPGGWLAVGHAENTAHMHDSFETVNCNGATLYQKSQSLVNRASMDVESMWHGTASSTLTQRPARSGIVVPRRKILSGSPNTCHRRVPSARNKSKCPLPTLGPGSEIEQIRILADQGNANAALDLCQALAMKEPLNPVHYLYRALLLDQLQRHDEALGSLNKAIYLDRQFILAHYYIGMIQRRSDNTVGAIKSFRNVLLLLEKREQSELLVDAEGMTVSELADLTRMHIETLEDM
jgi:chemotaxis protein methyltransferase CheR